MPAPELESRPLLSDRRRCSWRRYGAAFGVILALSSAVVAVTSSMRVSALEQEQADLRELTASLSQNIQTLLKTKVANEVQITSLSREVETQTQMLEASEAEIIALQAQVQALQKEKDSAGAMSMSINTANVFSSIPSYVTAWTSGQQCANFFGEYVQMLACEESDLRCPGSACTLIQNSILPPRPDVVVATHVNIPTLPWTDCEVQGGPGKCATLEFCAVPSEGIYGYRLPGTTACSAPGPTIRLTRGTKFWLKLHNTANESVVSNLHTHGLHIIGDGNSDDVTRTVRGGYAINYLWDLPSDHLGGTHWYHAHVHEVTKVQVVGGAWGLLIVEDSDEDFVNAVESARVKTFAQTELTVQLYKKLTANGVTLLSHDVIPEQWYRVRISMIDEMGTGGNLTVRGECDHHLVAMDGIWRSNVPAEPRSGYYVSGASRIDLAIRCRGEGAGLDVGGTQMVNFAMIEGTPNNGTPFSDGVSSTWARSAVPYLADQRGAEVDEENTLTIMITASSFNGAIYDPEISLAGGNWTLGEYHEWTLNSQSAHPLHLHLYPMQIQNDLCGNVVGNHEVGEFYDVIYKASQGCKVRFHPADHAGRCVVHCHLLSHEDNGAMSWLDIRYPDGESYVPSNDPPKEPYLF